MGYRKIPNLYNDQSVLLFRQVYVLEKIHGTSAHVVIPGDEKGKPVHLHSGGMNNDTFLRVFDGVRCPTLPGLVAVWEKIKRDDADLVVHGEAFGGKMQGMSKTYGPDARFYAFEVKVGRHWLSVPDAYDVCNKLGVPFVWHELVDATLGNLDRARDRPSQVAQDLLGIEAMAEGVVIRPPVEVTGNDGQRFMAKHKRPEFSERNSIPKIDPTAQEEKLRNEAAAGEFVNQMRCRHVVDALLAASRHGEGQDFALTMRHTPDFLSALVADIMAEESVPDTGVFRKSVSRLALPIWKKIVADAGRERIGDEGS